MSSTDPYLAGETASQVLLLLRTIQQGAIVLTGSVALYFAYWHTALADPIPIPLIILIGACAVSYLESYVYSAFALAKRDIVPNYNLLLRSSAPCSAALAIGYISICQLTYLRKWFEGDDWFRPIRLTEGWKLEPAGVEQHHSILALTIMVSGAVALISTLAVSGFAGTAVLKVRKQRGYVVVGEELDDDNETVYDLEDVEKRQ